MQADRFTIKSQEALQAAIAVAAARHHTETQPEHLLVALLEQPESVVGPVLRKLGARAGHDPPPTSTPRSSSFPTITAGAKEPCTSRELMDILRLAEREAGKLNDEYISTEHILLALTSAQAGEVAQDPQPQRRDAQEHARGDRGRPRPAPRHRPEPRGEVPGAAEVRPRPHAGRRGRQARPGHRPRRRDPPRHPGPVPPHEEQPGPDRRARRRQDRDRRGPRAADRLRRHPREPARPQGHQPRHRRPAGRLQVPRRVRGAPEGGPEGDRRRRGPGHPLHGRAAHDRRRRRRRGCGRRVQPAQADARPRRAARRRRDHARRVQEARREGRRARAPLPADLRRRADASRARSRSCAASRSATRPTTASRSPTPR